MGVAHEKACRKCVKPCAWRRSSKKKASRALRRGSFQRDVKGPPQTHSLGFSHHTFSVSGLNPSSRHLFGLQRNSPMTKTEVKLRPYIF